jgi:TP901 family phage tail tape measure protein
MSFSVNALFKDTISPGLQKVRQRLIGVQNSLRSNTQLTRQYTAALNQLTSANRMLSAQRVFAQAPAGSVRGGQFASGGPARISGISQTFASRGEANQFLSGMHSTQRQLDKVTASSERYERQNKKTSDSNRRQGVSFTQLLGLMIKFGIAMQIIMLPGRIIGGFMSMISAGVEFETGLANINALLRVSKEQLVTLGRELTNVAVATGSSGDILAAGYEAASSMTQILIDDSVNLVNVQKDLQGEARATAGLVELAARASVAGATDIDTAMEAIVRTTSGFGLNFEGAEQALDIMFKTVDRGVLSFADLATHVGEIVAGIGTTFGNDSIRKMKEFEGVSAAIAAVTRQLPAAQAFTSIRNLFRDLGRQSVGGEKLVKRLKELGANLTLDDFVAQGFAGTVLELNRTLAPQGSIIDKLAKAHGAFATAQDEVNFRQARSIEILQKLFPNIRTFRAVQALLINDASEFKTNLIEQADAAGEMNKQLVEQQKTVQNSINSFKALGQRIKFEFFLAIRDPLKRGIDLINEWLNTVTDTDAFRDAGFFEKFRTLWDGLSDEFFKWWSSGGKTKINSVTKTITTDFVQVLSDTLLSPENINKMTDVGVILGQGILAGFAKNIGKFLLNPFNVNKIDLMGPSGVSYLDLLTGKSKPSLTTSPSSNFSPEDMISSNSTTPFILQFNNNSFVTTEGEIKQVINAVENITGENIENRRTQSENIRAFE